LNRDEVAAEAMIVPGTSQSSAAVARHYDELDPFYREIWGDHVHHGYWKTGREAAAEASEALALLVADRLDLKDGLAVCDIGCGYGETARLFASRYRVTVEGVTISKSQHRLAASRPAEGVSIALRDWLENGFADRRFDRAYAIESSEHIDDKQRFFSEAFRVLKPGGRLVVCAWLAKTDAAFWQRRYLLEPICRQGRLPGMGCEEDYVSLARTAGFDVRSAEDISVKVRRTWTICIRRMTAKLIGESRYRAFVFARGSQNKVFALTMLLILAAYKTGAMRYCVFTFDKPDHMAP
jgi:tocopherol O-methyltransferase